MSVDKSKNYRLTDGEMQLVQMSLHNFRRGVLRLADTHSVDEERIRKLAADILATQDQLLKQKADQQQQPTPDGV